MQARIAYDKAAPEGVKAMWALENYARHCGLEPALLELVKFRASQINGCAYCIDMHTKDARAHGETEQRLYALSAWRADTPEIETGAKEGSGMECSFCGRPTTLLIGDRPVCEECYQNAGSCCMEFGGDDLWQRRGEESEGSQPDSPGGGPVGNQAVPGKPS